jgi:hypothetical protein
MWVNTRKEQGVTQLQDLQLSFFSFFLMIPSGYHRLQMKEKKKKKKRRAGNLEK